MQPRCLKKGTVFSDIEPFPLSGINCHGISGSGVQKPKPYPSMKRQRPPRPNRVEFETAPLTKRSWLCLALLALALFTGMLLWLCSEDRMVLKPGAPLVLNRWDDHAFAVLELPRTHRADLLVLGNSNIREALYSVEKIEAMYAAATGKPMKMVNLSTSGQSLLESLFLIYHSKLTPGQTIILVMSPSTFCRSESDYDRLRKGSYLLNPLDFSRTFAHEIPHLAPWVSGLTPHSINFTINRNLLYRRIHHGLHNTIRTQIYRDDLFHLHRYDHLDHADVSLQRQRLESFSKVIHQKFPRNFPMNLDILHSLARYTQKKQTRLILVESPGRQSDPEELFKPWWDPYRTAVDHLVSTHPITYANLNPGLGLTHEDFTDTRHLGPVGRGKWSRAFVAFFAHFSHGECRP